MPRPRRAPLPPRARARADRRAGALLPARRAPSRAWHDATGDPGLRGGPSLGRLGEDVAENGDDLVELRLLRDERRRDLHHRVAAVVRAADEAPLEEPRGEEVPQERLALLVRKGLARLLVLDELERVEEPRPAQIADDRQVEQLRQRRAEGVLLLGDVLDNPLPLHDLDVLERDGRHDRMAAERDPVGVHLRALEEGLHDRVADDHGADGRVGGREPLRRGDDVGPDVVAVGGKPGSDPPKPGDDLVAAQEDAVAVADLPHALEVALRRRERSAGVLHGLHDHHRDRFGPGLLDGRLEVLEEKRRELRLRLLGRTVVTICVAHVEDVGDERLVRRPERGDSVDRERPHRRPVVGDPPGDCLPAALAADGVVLPCQLPGGLDRLGPAGDEEDAVQIARGERRHLGGELDRSGMRIAPVRVEGELPHLGRGGIAHLLPEAVADVDREEACERVEVAIPLGVFEVAAVAPHDHRNLRVAVARHAREVQPEVIAGGCLQLGGGHRGGGDAHTAPFGWRRHWRATLASMRRTATKKMADPMTLLCGGMATRAAPQTKSGKVTTEPEFRYVITKSSTESANARSAAARMPGAINGSVTRVNVVHSLAPRSMAASSRWRSKPTSRAFTVTTT